MLGSMEVERESCGCGVANLKRAQYSVTFGGGGGG